MSLRDAFVDRPLVAVTLLSLLLRLATTATIVAVQSVFPAFDASAARLSVPLSPRLEGLVRWDTVYFLEIAKTGYIHEQRLAFFLGLPALLRAGGQVLAWCRGEHNAALEDMVIAGVGATTFATTAAALCLHRLTTALSMPERYATITTALFLLAPARSVLHAVPYTEPFSALFTYAAMLAYVRHFDLLAAALFAGGTLFRAQGAVLGIGFFGWRYLLEAPFQAKRFSIQRLVIGMLKTAILALIAASPFLVFQHYAYRQFCLSTSAQRPWCSSLTGFSYGWVQRQYWDVGPFRYWTLQQLPNFILAAPMLVLSFAASWSYYASQPRLVLARSVPFLRLPRSACAPAPKGRPFLSPALLPFVHLHTATTVMLLVSAHVQIILRLCITNPVVWWYAADLVLDVDKGSRRRAWGARWVTYAVVWGSISVVLWALFLPPA
ncbi:GPI-anchor transamidase GPI18 [Sporobolomyces koalae]|uniref:GPI-anchor transamidase GPI18 n=1 Tax=Sporobolomyces koalae TaxID=500713 RepID=UPI00317B160B